MDLILKMEYDKKTTSDFIIFLQEIYDNSKPFKSLKERKEYNLKYLEKAKQKFSHINGGIYPIEYITALVELFSIHPQDSSDKIAAVKEIFVGSGAAQETKNAIQDFTFKAFDTLQKISIDDNKKEMLRTFGENLMGRKV